MAQLIVGLTPALARALADGEPTGDTARLLDLIDQGHAELRPQSTRALDAPIEEAEAIVWFSAETYEADAPDLSAALLRIPGVTAAYVTPDQGPP